MSIRCALLACAILAASLALTGCHQDALRETPAAATQAKAWVKAELFFGLSQPKGGEVSAADWDAFLAGEVTPRFPEGLTVLDATGQWRDETGKVVREKSKLLILVYQTEPEKERAVEDLMRIYKQRFHQEAVLRVRQPVDVSF